MPGTRRASSIVGGIVFCLAGAAGIAATIYLHGAAWRWWDWTYRVCGSLLLVAAGIGNLLPDLTGKRHTALRARYELREPDEMMRGFTSTIAAGAATAVAVAAARRGDIAPAHALFHTTKGALRFLLVRLAHDYYVGTWPALQRAGMLDGLVSRTHGDPYYRSLRAYRNVLAKNVESGLIECDELAAELPDDPTPYLVKLVALRVGILERTVGDASRGAFQRDAGFEAFELELIGALACGRDLSPYIKFGRTIAAGAPDGSDLAFVPALAIHAAYTAIREHERSATAARDYLDGSANELDATFEHTLGSPSYRPSHRTLRMMHVLAALWTERGELERARLCFTNLGLTFDADIWTPFDDAYPARAFLAARKRVGL